MMQGPAVVKSFVTNYLAQDLPSRLLSYRNAMNLDEDSLPEPLLYLNYEPVALDHWPTIITIALSTASITRMEYDASLNPEYRVKYNMRTYVWVKTDGSMECTEMRDNLTMVVRSALLDHPMLNAYDDGCHSVLVDEGTMREEFSDLTLVKGERVLAGAYIAYDINLDETITRQNVSDSLDQIKIYSAGAGLTSTLGASASAEYKWKGIEL